MPRSFCGGLDNFISGWQPDTSLLVAKITFVVGEITFKVIVITSSVVRITFVIAEITFKVAVVTSSVAKITFVVAEIILKWL